VNAGFFVHEPPAAPRLSPAHGRTPSRTAPQVTPGSRDWTFIPGTKARAPELAPFDPRVWENHDSVLIGTFLLALAYLWAVGPLRKKKGWPRSSRRAGRSRSRGPARAAPLAQRAAARPVGFLPLQHAHGAAPDADPVMAPLLILGLPTWLIEAIVARPSLSRAARFLGTPPGRRRAVHRRHRVLAPDPVTTT